MSKNKKRIEKIREKKIIGAYLVTDFGRINRKKRVNLFSLDRNFNYSAIICDKKSGNKLESYIGLNPDLIIVNLRDSGYSNNSIIYVKKERAKEETYDHIKKRRYRLNDITKFTEEEIQWR